MWHELNTNHIKMLGFHLVDWLPHKDPNAKGEVWVRRRAIALNLEGLWQQVQLGKTPNLKFWRATSRQYRQN